jgi:hypothetical protein
MAGGLPGNFNKKLRGMKNKTASRLASLFALF